MLLDKDNERTCHRQITFSILAIVLVSISILSFDSASASGIFEPPSIERIQEQIPNATVLEKDKDIKGEVNLDEYNNSFDLYIAVIPTGEDDLWIHLEGRDYDGGKVGLVYFYENLSRGEGFSTLQIKEDSYKADLLRSSDLSKNCTIYIVVYGNGKYSVGMDSSTYFSIWYILVPIIIVFIIIILSPVLFAIITIITAKKRISQRRKMIEANGPIHSGRLLKNPEKYFKSSKGRVKSRRTLWIILIGSLLLSVLLLILGFFIPTIKIGEVYIVYWLQPGILLIILAVFSMFILWIESISNKPGVPSGLEMSLSGKRSSRPFKESIPNITVIFPVISLILGFLIYGVLIRNNPGHFFIMIEILILTLISFVTIPIFSIFNIEARPDRIEFFYGPRVVWKKVPFIGKSIPLKDIYSIAPVSVHPIRDYFIGTWWIKIGRKGEYGYLTLHRTGVSIITMEGKEYIVSTRDPMKLVKFVNERKKGIIT